MRVFDLDGGVVHQNADCQGQPAQGHDVDRMAHQTEDDQGGENRQRNRDTDNYRAAPASQEQQDHDAGEEGGNERFADDPTDGRAHEKRLVEELPDLQFLWQARQDPGQSRLHGFDDGQCRGFSVSQNREQRAARSIDPHDTGLHGIAVAHLGHVPHVDSRAIHHLDGQVVELVQQLGTAVELYLVIDVAELGSSRRENEVLLAQGTRNVRRREPFGVERLRIEVDHHLPELAAERQRDRGPLHGGQLRTNKVQPQIEELLLAERLALQAQLQNGDAGGVVLDDARRESTRWKNAQERLAEGRHLRQRHFNLDVGLKVDARNGNAAVSLCLDVFDVIDRGGHGALEDGVNAFFHLVGRNASVVPDHADHRDIDVRKNIHRHGDDGRSAEQRDQHRHRDKSVRAP